MLTWRREGKRERGGIDRGRRKGEKVGERGKNRGNDKRIKARDFCSAFTHTHMYSYTAIL